MQAGLVALGEDAGAFQHDVDAHFAPRQFGRVADRQELDRLTIDHQLVAGQFHGARERAVDGVVLGQVGVQFRIAQIVDGNDFNILVGEAFLPGTQYHATDTAIAVNCQFQCHDDSSFTCVWPDARPRPDV
ncbi:hypothetical protein D3C86_1784200 [compost metagenome]